MSDKTQLEKDIEQKEQVRKPFSSFILIIILLISLGGLGMYTFKLRQTLAIKEQELGAMRSRCDAEKSVLSDRIKELEKECGIDGLDSEPAF